MNWQDITQDLIRSGLTQVYIAERVGCSQPSINDIAHGKSKNLSWKVGDGLLALHRVHCQNKQSMEVKEAINAYQATDQCR